MVDEIYELGTPEYLENILKKIILCEEIVGHLVI